MHDCKFCGKILSSGQRLKTHIMAMHKKPTNYWDSDDQDQSNSESEETDVGSDVSETEDNEDENEIADEKNEEELAVWSQIIHLLVCKDKEDVDIETEDGALCKKKLFKLIRNGAEDLVELIDQLRATKVYSRIHEEKRRLEKNKYEEDEAVRSAWKNRKYMIMKNIVEPYLNSLNSEDEQDEEDC